MAIVNFTGGGKGKTANKGSCADLMNYLLHELEERIQSGQHELFDAQSCLFNDTIDRLALEDAIKKIDRNRKGLKKDEAKFSHVDYNPSQGELDVMFKGCNTDLEREDAIRSFIRNSFIPEYAANFKGYRDKNGNEIEFKADDIVWVAAIHSRRLDRYGKLKEGPGWHAHIVISRRNHDMTRSLSPTRNQRKENKGCCQGGFDRNVFRKKLEEVIEKKYSYQRPLGDSVFYRCEVPSMSTDEICKRGEAAIKYAIQLQLELDERLRAREKAAKEEAEAKRKAEEQAKAEAEKATKEKVALEAEAKQKAAEKPVEKPDNISIEKSDNNKSNNEYQERLAKEAPAVADIMAWKAARSKTDCVVFVERFNSSGTQFFSTFNEDAELVAPILNRNIKTKDYAKLGETKGINVNFKAMGEVLARLREAKTPCIIVDGNGKMVGIRNMEKIKKIKACQLPEGVKVEKLIMRGWLDDKASKVRICGIANGQELPEFECSWEDYNLYKSGDVSADNIVAENYDFSNCILDKVTGILDLGDVGVVGVSSGKSKDLSDKKDKKRRGYRW